MGNVIKSSKEFFNFKQNRKIAIIGPEGVGKTSFIFKIKPGEIISSTPTTIPHIEILNFKNFTMTIADTDNQTIKKFWADYFSDTDAFIFMVDRSEKEIFEKCKIDFDFLKATSEFQKVPVLIYANKEDIAIISTEEIVEELGLELCKSEWNVQNCSILTGNGLYEGLEWLTSKLKNEKSA